jgi:hypothetical protein
MPPPLPARRRAALLGAALVFAHPPARPSGAAEADGAPPPPADAPPAPALLSPDSRPADGAAPFEALAEGRWRIRFASGREDLSEAAALRIEELGRRLAESAEGGRVTVEAQSSGPEADVSGRAAAQPRPAPWP